MTRSASALAVSAFCAVALLGGCASQQEKEMEAVNVSAEKVRVMQRGMSQKEKDAMADACRKDTVTRSTGRASLNTWLLDFNECLLRLGK